MSKFLGSPHASRRSAVANSDGRALRMEHLEPRLVLSAGVASQKAAAATVGTAVVLDAAADAYVSSNTPLTNYGQSANLLVQSSVNRNTCTSVSYLKFDLSSVGGTASKAVLNLTSLAKSSASSATITIQLLRDSADAWVEGTGGTSRGSSNGITWSNAVNGYGQTLTLTLSAAQLKNTNSLAIDVTRLISQSFNTNGVASFVIKAVSTFGRGPVQATSMTFASSENATVAYRPTLTVTTSTTNPAPTVAAAPSITSQTDTTVSLSTLGADSVDGETSLTYTWSVTSSPTGADSPTFSSNGTNASKDTTVTFGTAGTYTFTVKITDPTDGLSVTSTITVTVAQTLSSISLSPDTVTVALGGTQTFTVSGADQFGDSMTVASGSVQWAASAGEFSSGTTTNTVTYVAPSSATSATITATCGAFSATAVVSVVKSNFLELLDATLASLTQNLYADGSISRADMIAIFTTVAQESDGTVDSTDLSDLKTILKNSTTLCMANYVLVLAKDVVNGSTANATYLGTTLGNLAVGSTNAQLTKLVNKWFYGTDLPTTSYSYDTTTAGTLFSSSGASYTDEQQGNLGDCYLLSALGSIADSSTTAISNMFINNGDGTWTVRFYYNGTADYVTVNSQLPVDSSGDLIYQGYGNSSASSSNVLWLALLEKAYAQWNETGKTGRDTAANTYASIEGGWMSDVYAQTLGYSATDYYTSSSSAKQALISAVTSGKAVTIGTVTNPASGTGLYGNHAYNVLSYNSSTGKFTLYNPWGSNQPNQLTWAQLQKSCDAFAVADTSGSVAISSKASVSRTMHTPSSVISPRVDAAEALTAAKSHASGMAFSAGETVTLPAIAEKLFLGGDSSNDSDSDELPSDFDAWLAGVSVGSRLA